MKEVRILSIAVLVVVLAGLALGTACAGAKGEQGPKGDTGADGVGIENIVNNGDGTFTVNLTDGESYATDNLTGPQGIQGIQGDPGVQGAQMATCYGETGIDMDWNLDEGLFFIDPEALPRLLGSGFSANSTVKIYLVVASTRSVLVATVTTNSIGCFYAELDILNEAGDSILVEPDASLDRTRFDGDGYRECYFQAEVDGQQVTTWPILLWGNQYTIVEEANAELVTLQAAIEATLADANAAQFDAAVTGWDGTTRETGPVVDYPAGGAVEYAVYDFLVMHQFKAAYDISVTGEVTYGDPTITGGWGSEIQWNVSTHEWEEAP